MNRFLRSITFTGLLFSLLLLLGSINEVHASHAMGADLSYQCLDPSTNTYKIVLRFYRDCFGIDAPQTITLTYESASCGQSLSVDLTQEACPPNPFGGTPCEVSPLCAASIGQSTCNGGTLPGVQAFTYTATITLPQNCPDWTFSFDECCRNDQITNLVNPGGVYMHVQATLNNTTGGCNNSPIFTSLPVPFICANQPFSYNHGAVDADGDSLVYTLITPLGQGGINATYNGGFSSNYPLSTSTGTLPFNTSTGQMNFTPNTNQVAVVTVLVQEYRNGVLIGTTMRDIQIVVVNLPGCANPAPTFTGAIQPTVQNGFYVSPSVVQVCPGQPLQFSSLAIEQSGDSIFVQSNIAQSIPGAQYTTSYISGDSVNGVLRWTPTALDTGQHTFIVTVRNNNCPLASNQAYAITIDVLAGTYAGPDIAYCPAGGPVQLQAYGGSAFTWSPATGLNNPNIGNPTAAPVQTTQYIVVSNLSSACKNRDTVIVNRVPDFNYTLNQSDDTICRFEFVQLSANPEATFGPYTFAWSPTTSLNAANIYNPVAQPDFTTNYVVKMKANNGCIINDTIRVVVEGQGPGVKITADKTKACVGDTIHLNADISTLPCGLNVVPCSGNFSIKTIGTGTSNANTPYAGLFEDNRMQILFRASELQAQGMVAGTITDIAFDISQRQSTLPYSNFTIKMGCTDLNYLSGFVPGLSVVMIDPAFVPSGTGFNNHNFNTPYDWDGQSNLIVEICYDNNAFSFNDAVNATNTGYNSVIFDGNDNAVGCNLNTPTADQFRPNIQFVYCEAQQKTITYSWNPTTNLYVPDSLNPIVVLNQSTTYYLTANDGSCSGGSSITLNIDTSFGISAGPDVSFCNGIPVQLQASVTGTPPNGGAVDCGANGSPCTGTPAVHTVTLPGATSSTVTPFDGAFFSTAIEAQRTQLLYHASDLLAAGFRAGTINQIGFNVSGTGASIFQDLNIKMGCTAKPQLSDTVWEPTSLVYTPGLIPVFTPIPGWNDLDLPNTFDWDGISNLVIEICWSNAGAPSFGQVPVSASPVNYNSFVTKTSGSGVGCNLTIAGAQLHSVLPEFRARVCAAPPLPITYLWTPASGLSNTNVSNPTATPSGATTYHLTAYFGGACPRYDSVTVTPQTFSYSLSNDTNVCKGYSVTLSASGGSSYTWQPATYLNCTDCDSVTSTPDTAITYYVHITDTTSGCSVNDSVSITVLTLDATALFNDVGVDQGTPITLGAVVIGGNGTYAYNWSPSDYLDNATSATPVSTPLADIVYTLTVTSGPCQDTASVNVHVNIVESPVKVPNAFTPNGDGRNDVFYPVMMNASISKVKTFRIYNRYGEMVHNSNTPWDGRFKGTMQPAGTFVYYIEIERPLKEDEKLQGSFTLLH